MKRRPPGGAHILAAIERLAAKGKRPTLPAVRGELLRSHQVGASYGTILPILRRWKLDAVERASGRIETAADAILALRTADERRKVRQLVAERSAGGLVARIMARKVRATRA